MLCRHRSFLSQQHIVLGSSSPQRKRIFDVLLCLPPFTITSPSFTEDIPKAECGSAKEYCLRTTQGKVEALNKQLNFDYDILVCADTVVVTAHGEILEKPMDASNAMQMLLELSNSTCRVYTSCILSYRVAGQPRRVVTHVEQTELTFHPLQPLDIAAYIDTGEPFGKSGAFALQAMGSTLVKSIKGCPYSVEGFPASAFAALLSRVIDESTATAAASAAGNSDQMNVAPVRPLTVQQAAEEEVYWKQLVGTASGSGWLQPLQINANTNTNTNADADAKRFSSHTSCRDGDGTIGDVHLYSGSKATYPAAENKELVLKQAGGDEAESDLEELEQENHRLQDMGGKVQRGGSELGLGGCADNV